MTLPERKNMRLPQYDYGTEGAYFLTFCTKNKEKILCSIVRKDDNSPPEIYLTRLGKVVEDRICEMAHFYETIVVDKYAIMPNHVHLLLRVSLGGESVKQKSMALNNPISQFVGTLKRLTNRAWGTVIWQPRSYDHVIRNEEDYWEIYEYIENNPSKWAEDCFFS